MLGKKQLEQLSTFTATFISFSVASFIGMVFITDWKPIVSYIPYYNTKFKDEKKEPEKSC